MLRQTFKIRNSYKFWLFTLSVVMLGIFGVIAILVHKHYLSQLDFDLTVKLKDHLPLKAYKLFPWFGFFVSFPVVSLCLIFFSVLWHSWKVSYLWLGYLGGHLIEILGKTLIHQPNPPFMFYHRSGDFSFSDYYIHPGFSYPSGHSFRITFLSIVIGIWICQRQAIPKFFKNLVLLILAGVLISVGISRVGLGEHWATDVIGGVLLGVSLGTWSTIWLIKQ